MAIDLTELAGLMEDAAGTAVSNSLAGMAGSGIAGVLSGIAELSNPLGGVNTGTLSGVSELLSLMDTFKDAEPFGVGGLANLSAVADLIGTQSAPLSGLAGVMPDLPNFASLVAQTSDFHGVQASLAEYATAGILDAVKPFIESPLTGLLQTAQPIMQEPLFGFASQLEPILAGITAPSFLGESGLNLAASAFAGLDLGKVTTAGIGSFAFGGLQDLDFTTPFIQVPSADEITELPMSPEVGRYDALVEAQLLTVSLLERISTQLTELSAKPLEARRASTAHRLLVAGFVVAVVTGVISGVSLFT